MLNIKISKELKEKLPDFCLAAITFRAKYSEEDQLRSVIENLEKDIRNKYTLEDVLKITNIKAARDGYKKLGKDPSRYRLACESLFRRVVKEKDLYRISNLVDLGNILSLQTERSVAVLDIDKIQGEVLIRIGQDEPYEGIGRGQINIENIPVYSDELGSFGSPTSDTPRTMITETTTNILLFIISFNGENELDKQIEMCIELYNKYAEGKDYQYKIIK